MIASLRGTVLSATPLLAIIEAGGVGYEVHVPVTTAERLPPPGATAFLHIHAVYREDAQNLYGFATATERDFFRLMVEKVSGVGPKVALAVMSRLSLPALQGAIAAGDVHLLSQCPGIGRKTAERLVLDLKDHVAPGTIVPPAGPATAPAATEPSRITDAIAALVALGYKLPEADKAVRKAVANLGPDATTEALIKRALG